VHVKIKEGNRERIQEFKGIVIYTHNRGNDSSLLFAAWQPMALALNGLFSHAAPGLTRLWLNAAPKSVVHAFTFCANGQAKAPASNRNSVDF